jgi:hypothetical protein
VIATTCVIGPIASAARIASPRRSTWRPSDGPRGHGTSTWANSNSRGVGALGLSA